MSSSTTRRRYLTILTALTAIASVAHAQSATAPLPTPAAPPTTVAPVVAAAATGSFRVSFDAALQTTPYTGRVYVVLGKNAGREPRMGMGDWFNGTQVFALDVKNIAPGTPIVVGPESLGFPKSYIDVAPGDYTVQAVARRNLDSPSAGQGAGDLYSEAMPISFSAGENGAAEFTLSKVVAARQFKESERVKLFEARSEKLSAFLHRDFSIHAGVILPKDWKDDASQHYPTLYWIGGFGSNHFAANSMARQAAAIPGADKCLIIVPDPTCYRGHSVFADSANNGPWGAAFVQELVPAVEAKYHGSITADHRYVAGISSGGWSSLWLQVTYPDSFNGVWSHCPDPVDFHDFQQIDLYAPGTNMYKDAAGNRRPLARNGETVMLWYDDFVRQEIVLGPGGQIHAFEGVFSPCGPNGEPVALFDRTTGMIDFNTAKSWEPYDIRLLLERNWATLGPKLKGKLHVIAGGVDTFYLDGAVKRLQESMQNVGSDADIQVIDGMTHSVHEPAMRSMFDLISGSR